MRDSSLRLSVKTIHEEAMQQVPFRSFLFFLYSFSFLSLFLSSILPFIALPLSHFLFCFLFSLLRSGPLNTVIGNLGEHREIQAAPGVARSPNDFGAF